MDSIKFYYLFNDRSGGCVQQRVLMHYNICIIYYKNGDPMNSSLCVFVFKPWAARMTLLENKIKHIVNNKEYMSSGEPVKFPTKSRPCTHPWRYQWTVVYLCRVVFVLCMICGVRTQNVSKKKSYIERVGVT